jgi:hypothetical protein
MCGYKSHLSTGYYIYMSIDSRFALLIRDVYDWHVLWYVTQDMYFLDTSSWCWVRVSTTSPAVPHSRFNHASVLVGNKIVISGGWNGKDCYDDLWVFDTGKLAHN